MKKLHEQLNRFRVHATLGGIAAAGLAMLMTVGASSTAIATNLSFMKDTPYSRFSAEDRKIFAAAVDSALAKSADGESSEWSNPTTGATGTIKALKTTQRGDLPCRTLAIANKAKGLSATSEHQLCKDKSGKWTLSN
jgi:surface antigen